MTILHPTGCGAEKIVGTPAWAPEAPRRRVAGAAAEGGGPGVLRGPSPIWKLVCVGLAWAPRALGGAAWATAASVGVVGAVVPLKIAIKKGATATF